MDGFHTRGRPVAGLYWPARDLWVNTWCGDEGAFIFRLHYLGATFDVQTRREGIEAIRDACNDALVRTDD
jgi:hypothetical protein